MTFATIRLVIVLTALQAARLGKGQMPETVPLHARQHPTVFAKLVPLVPRIIPVQPVSHARPAQMLARLGKGSMEKAAPPAHHLLIGFVGFAKEGLSMTALLDLYA
jgi:hypothetical protein